MKSRIISMLIAFAIVFTTAIPSSAVYESTGITAHVPDFIRGTGNAYVWELLQRTNRERIAVGALPLSTTEALQSAAKIRADETVTSPSHSRPNGSGFSTVFAEVGININGAVSENINRGAYRDTIADWLNSPGHGENMLSEDYTRVGIGYTSVTAFDHRWVQLFIGHSCQVKSLEIGSIVSNPFFTLGQSIEELNLTVVLTCDCSTSYMPLISEMCSELDSFSEERQTITVKYGDLLAEFSVTLQPQVEWEYEFCSEGISVIITKYNGTDTVVTIPSVIGELPVTEIGQSAFRDNETITSVTIPQGVTRIGDWAFSFCRKLGEINFPDTVVDIGFRAFANTGFSGTLTLENNVAGIGHAAFLYSGFNSVIIMNPDCEINNTRQNNLYLNENGDTLNADGIETFLFGFANSTLETYASRFGKKTVNIHTANGIIQREETPFRFFPVMSDVYIMGNRIISGVQPETTVEEFRNNISGDITIGGQGVSNDTIVDTNMIVEIIDHFGEVQEFRIIMTVMCDSCNNCTDCGFNGGRFGLGRVRGDESSEIPEISDALQILRSLIGLSSVFDSDSPIRNDALIAGNITNAGQDVDTLVIADALQVLRFLIGLSTVDDWGARYR